MSTTTRLRLTPADHGRTLMLEEFLDADEEPGYRYELARGVLEVTEVPNDAHGLIEWHLLGLIRDYERDHPGVIHRAGSSGSVRLWLPVMVSGRNPDIAVILVGAPKDPRNRRRPDLAMEIVSEGRMAHQRDYVTKREEYLAYGLLEYWIVDPFARRVTVLIRDGDVWVERVFQNDQAAVGLVLPGFAVRLPELWAAAEEADDDDTDTPPEPPPTH